MSDVDFGMTLDSDATDVRNVSWMTAVDFGMTFDPSAETARNVSWMMLSTSGLTLNSEETLDSGIIGVRDIPGVTHDIRDLPSMTYFDVEMTEQDMTQQRTMTSLDHLRLPCGIAGLTVGITAEASAQTRADIRPEDEGTKPEAQDRAECDGAPNSSQVPPRRQESPYIRASNSSQKPPRKSFFS